MIHTLSYIESNSTSPQYNLAMEEYLLLHCLCDQCILYLWQNEHTVVIGKNQNAWKECNISKLEEENGTLVRRLSGGGCVYHDLGNLNFTFIMHKDYYDIQKQSDVILNALKKLGIDAYKSGRNDLLIEEKKFSGHAYYKQKGICYHHGTLMVNVNKESLSKYLNVSKDKLKAKGVDSVKSRITNLTEYREDLTIPMLKEALINSFKETYNHELNIIHIDENMHKDILVLKEKYASWEYTKGNQFKFTNEFHHRFTWGDISLLVKIDNGIIEQIEIYSDAMDIDIFDKMKDVLLHQKYDKKIIYEQINSLYKEYPLYIKDLCLWINTLEL